MPRALLISPEAPYPVAGGGAIRTASVIEYLAPRYELDLVLFREAGAPDPHAALPQGRARDTVTIDLPFHSRSVPARAARNVGRFLRGVPPLNDRFSGFERRLAAFLDGRRYEIAVVEHFWCAGYAGLLAAHAARLILDLHNVESVLYERCHAAEPWPISVIMKRFAGAARRLERLLLPRFSLVLVPSKADALAVGDARVRVYPNALPKLPQPGADEEEVIAFSGNLDYRPNISAVRFFRREVWPLLRERWPRLRWRLIGMNPAGVAKEVAGDSRIELQGPVADAVAALARARIVVAPLLAGSGTRLKILEAWAAARPVVSTTIGAEGLPVQDGRDLLVADSAEAFAHAVSRLLESRELRATLGAAGRRLYEHEFTWPRAWAKLATIGL